MRVSSLLVLCLAWTSLAVAIDNTIECPYANEIAVAKIATAGIWRENRARLAALALQNGFPTTSLIFLTGDHSLSRYPFRQSSNFLYVSGANMPNYYISLQLRANNLPPVATLFVPEPSADYAIWNGHVYSKEQLRLMFDVDDVLYTNELAKYADAFPATWTLYTITSSVALPNELNKFTINRSLLQSVMTISRATKSQKEILLMSLINKISSFAHVGAMEFIAARLNDTYGSAHRRFVPPSSHAIPPFSANIAPESDDYHVPMDDVARAALASLGAPSPSYRPNVAPVDASASPDPVYEYEVQSYFVYRCALCDARMQAYLPIVGSGNNGAVLHYKANNDALKDGDLILVDAAGELWGYGADITRTYPVNGIYTVDQRLIYSIVLRAQAEVVKNVRAGVQWSTLNTIARAAITQYLLDAGLIQGTIAELQSNNVYNIFYMHSIGHSVGLDVHDSQTATLEANQVITVEPGVYFNEYLLDQAKAGPRSRFIVWSRVDQFRGTGGVRIEDIYVVTSSGCISLTEVPSDMDAIEKIMQK